jgi:hypothetical protein
MVIRLWDEKSTIVTQGKNMKVSQKCAIGSRH